MILRYNWQLTNVELLTLTPEFYCTQTDSTCVSTWVSVERRVADTQVWALLHPHNPAIVRWAIVEHRVADAQVALLPLLKRAIAPTAVRVRRGDVLEGHAGDLAGGN